MGNSFITRIIAWIGIVVAATLCVFDFVTSVMGIQSVMGPGDGGIIAFSMPYCFGALAFVFNALSSFIFRMYMRRGFTKISFVMVFVMWIFFLGYDGLSSFIGILGIYTNTEVNSWASMKQAMDQMGGLSAFLVFVMSALLAFGPFLLTPFGELTTVTDDEIHEGRERILRDDHVTPGPRR